MVNAKPRSMQKYYSLRTYLMLSIRNDIHNLSITDFFMIIIACLKTVKN